MKVQHSPRVHARRRAFTMTELIVVLAILILLTTIIVPVVMNRAEQARLTSAREEARRLADAEEEVISIHGFIIPLQMLDDVAAETVFTGNLLRDDLLNETSIATNMFVIDPFQDLVTQSLTQLRLFDAPTVPRINDMLNNWAGPFVNFRRYFQGSLAGVGQRERLRRDFPLDPWGQPYRLVCNTGVIGAPGNTGAMSVIPNDWDNDQTFDGRLPNTSTDPSRRFDRFAILSFGPDMKSSESVNAPEQADDIIVFFGGTFTPQSFKAFF